MPKGTSNETMAEPIRLASQILRKNAIRALRRAERDLRLARVSLSPGWQAEVEGVRQELVVIHRRLTGYPIDPLEPTEEQMADAVEVRAGKALGYLRVLRRASSSPWPDEKALRRALTGPIDRLGRLLDELA